MEVWPRAANDRIAIVDPGDGVSATHEELAGRVGGITGSSDHSTRIAGIIAAKGDNGLGIAGLNWNGTVVSQPFPASDVASAADAIVLATDRGIKIHNDSWNFTNFSQTMDLSLAYAYEHNVLSCVSAPAVGADGDYPGSLGHGILTVGATNANDVRTSYTLARTYVDVAAPGGDGNLAQGRDIPSTIPGNSYDWSFGTSYAAAHASGVASLLQRYATDSLGITLYNDDLEQIIRRSTQAGTSGPYTGAGRINALTALRWLGTPNTIYQQTASGGNDEWASPIYLKDFVGNPCISDGTYQVILHVVRKTVAFPITFPDTPFVWGRGAATVGYDDAGPNFGEGWCAPTAITNSGCTLETYVFQVFGYPSGQFIGWCPTDPAHVVYAWTAMAQPSYTPTTVDTLASYYVPQSGDKTFPSEGQDAIPNFRMCPNNDAASVPNNARIKVVAYNGGSPIKNYPGSDIYVLLNGGTTAQSFFGLGADSIIANSRWNQAPLCPDVQVIEADAPTDSAGVTYITFKGASPANPGVAVRDPSRKWGHYDSELPVYIGRTKIKGRLTSGSANGSYVLQIKNLDLEGGLVPGPGEQVTSADFNSVSIHVGQADSDDAKNWWRDFDSDGWVLTTDFNLVSLHVGHSCTSPNNP